MRGMQYEVTFSNGEREVLDSFEEAHGLAMGRAGDGESQDLAPVEIWELGPDGDGGGRIVEVVYAEGKVTRVAAPH